MERRGKSHAHVTIFGSEWVAPWWMAISQNPLALDGPVSLIGLLLMWIAICDNYFNQMAVIIWW